MSGMLEVVGRAFIGPGLVRLSVLCWAFRPGLAMLPGFTRLSLVEGPFLTTGSVSLLLSLGAALVELGNAEVFSPKDFLLLTFKLLRGLEGGTILVFPTEALLEGFEVAWLLRDRFSLDLLAAPGAFSIEGLFKPVCFVDPCTNMH